MTDHYAYWRRALALAGDGGKLTKAQVSEVGPITSEPECGFWRKAVVENIDGKRVHLPSVPVAIWREGAKPVAKVNGVEAGAEDVWTWCADKPISYETYVAVGERGEHWPQGIE